MNRISHFLCMLSRMKYIVRWGLMRNTRQENLAEHSLETAIIAHTLAIIHNRRLGGEIDANRVAVCAMYHDISEILTGDLPTPVKYYNPAISSSYKDLERLSSEKLLSMLPEDLRDDFSAVVLPDDMDDMAWKLVQYADKLSAYIKCIEEEQAGNREFVSAKSSIQQAILDFHAPEVQIFLEEFLPGYYHTIDETTSF